MLSNIKQKSMKQKLKSKNFFSFFKTFKIPLFLSSLNGQRTVLSGQDFSWASIVSMRWVAAHPNTSNLQGWGTMLLRWPAIVFVLDIRDPRQIGQNVIDCLQDWQTMWPWEQDWTGRCLGNPKHTGHWIMSIILASNPFILCILWNLYQCKQNFLQREINEVNISN